jgi:hypothetical protein
MIKTLIQILLPRYDNNGAAFARSDYLPIERESSNVLAASPRIHAALPAVYGKLQATRHNATS